MYRFLESIRIENGKAINLDGHLSRMNKALQKMNSFKMSLVELNQLLIVPQDLRAGIVKARVLYDERGAEVHFIEYSKLPIIRLILKCGDHIIYNHKYANRRQLDELKSELDDQEDVLVIKNNQVTDTTYCNVAFFDGIKWCTPRFPLLKGTQRQKLIDLGILTTAIIKLIDLQKFSKIRMFNALIPWEEAIEISTKNIIEQ